MAKGCAILLLWITIGISGCNPAVAKDCFYSQQTTYSDGSIINDIKKYDCKSPPKVVIIEKEIPSKDRGLGEFLFGAEENNQSISKLFEVVLSLGVL